MNFKRKRRHSKLRCGICAGQRRRFGAGNQKMRAVLKARSKVDTLQPTIEQLSRV